MNEKRTVTTLVLAGLLGFGLVACGGDTTSSADGQEAEPASNAEARDPGNAVTIKGFVFKPGSIEVQTGTEVTWTNEDQILHTVAAGTPPNPAGSFGGELADRGAVYRFTFDDPGTYPYFCERHNSMTGTVIVK